MTSIVVHYKELALKGRNRPWFVQVLVRNLKTALKGLDIAGIRPMQIRVPLGTSTGWNVRAAGHREPTLCGLTGSFIPFARTGRETARRTHDLTSCAVIGLGI